MTTGQFHELADRVYHQRGRVTAHQKDRLTSMRLCAASPAAHRAMRRMLHRQAHARRHRAVLAARLCGTPVCNRRLGQHMTVLRYGPQAWPCVDYIVMHESQWRTTVVNYGGSGAYGIPQALPGSKMASEGADWATNPRTQIRWLLTYLHDRYGGPCGGAAYWRSHSSY